MSDSVTDPIATGSGDDSFAGDVAAVTPVLTSVGNAVGQYEQGQANLQLASIGQNTVIWVVALVAAIFILPSIFKSV